MTTTVLSGRICECGRHFPMGSGICECGRLYADQRQPVSRPADCVCQWKGPGHHVTDPGCPALHVERQPREHAVPCRGCGTPSWAVSGRCESCAP